MKGNFLASCLITAVISAAFINSAANTFSDAPSLSPSAGIPSVNPPLAAAYLAAATQINFSLSQKSSVCADCNFFNQTFIDVASFADGDVIRL